MLIKLNNAVLTCFRVKLWEITFRLVPYNIVHLTIYHQVNIYILRRYTNSSFVSIYQGKYLLNWCFRNYWDLIFVVYIW